MYKPVERNRALGAGGTTRPNSTYDQEMGRSGGFVIIAIGVVIVMIGLLALSGALSWFGRLPGDVRIRNEHSRIYIPIVSSIVISVVLSVILSLARRFF